MSQELRSRFDDHLSRKFFHMTSGTIVAYLFIYVFERQAAILLISIAAIVLVSFDLLRIKTPWINKLVLKYYGPLMRKDEENAPSAQVYYLLGLMWCVLFLPKVIAVQAILTLAWMDPVAGAWGVRFGKRRWNSIFRFFIPSEKQIPLSLGAKTFEGSAAGFVAAFAAGAVAWTGRWATFTMPSGDLRWPGTNEILLMSGIGALAAVVAEAWPSQWDDNAKIPFWTGLVVWILAQLVNIPLSYL